MVLAMTTLQLRRRTLELIGVSLAFPLIPTRVLADDHPLTPRMTEGPFFPTRFPKDIDADLTRVAGRAEPAVGTILDVSGRIVDRAGRPITDARLEVWQCDHTGQYRHVGEPEGAGDPGFQGFGLATVDAEGRYRFRTIRPVAYGSRAPHIHFIVKQGALSRLTSQMFVEGDPGNERDGLYRRLGADQKRVTMKLEDAPKRSGAALRGALDIVLA